MILNGWVRWNLSNSLAKTLCLGTFDWREFVCFPLRNILKFRHWSTSFVCGICIFRRRDCPLPITIITNIGLKSILIEIVWNSKLKPTTMLMLLWGVISCTMANIGRLWSADGQINSLWFERKTKALIWIRSMAAARIGLWTAIYSRYGTTTENCDDQND